MTSTTKTDVISPATQIAREAGALLMEYFRRRVAIEYKGDADLVTIADRKSEALIRQRLHEHWPSHDILGEEGGLQDTGSDYRWYVDPLDGTTNFAHGFPVFCVSMALEYKGKRIAGVIYDPTRDELFAAEQGSGAYLNDQRIRVSKTANSGREPGGHRLSQPQTPQESQYLFLSSDYPAHSRRTPRRFRSP